MQQLIDQAVQSSDVVDILAAAGLQRPDISILSEEFLAEVQGLKTRNLALEALQKLLTDSLKMRSKTDVVQVKAFTERLESAMARYHAHSLTTEEMIQELVRMAHDMKASLNRGDDLGLTEEEIAFYDALAENESAVQVLGSPKLKVIAQELVSS